jgi:hypothetical protein
MKKWYKCLAGLLALTMMGFGYPKLASCKDSPSYAKAGTKSITRHDPRIKSEPEKDILLEQADKKEEKGTAKWILYGLGAALAVGLALGAGGGGGGGGDDPQPDRNPGSVTVGW